MIRGNLLDVTVRTCAQCGKNLLSTIHPDSPNLHPIGWVILSDGRALCESCHERSQLYGRIYALEAKTNWMWAWIMLELAVLIIFLCLSK